MKKFAIKFTAKLCLSDYKFEADTKKEIEEIVLQKQHLADNFYLFKIGRDYSDGITGKGHTDCIGRCNVRNYQPVFTKL